MSGSLMTTLWWQYITPTALPNIEVFYDAAQSKASTFNNGVIASGTEITSWHNDGTLTSHDWNSTGGQRPEWYSNIQNGLGVVRFNNTTVGVPSGEDGDNNENLTINPVTYLQSLTGATMAIAFRSLTANSGTRYCTSTDTNGYQWGQTGNTWIGGFAGATYTVNGVTADTNFHYITVKFDGTQSGNANKIKVRLDSVDCNLTFTGTAGANTSSSVKYFYGGATGTSSSDQNSFWIGDIGEVLIFTRALSASEIITIENYLSTKWAL